MEEDLAVERRNGHVYSIERAPSGNTPGKFRSDKKVGEFLTTMSTSLDIWKGIIYTDFSGGEDVTEKAFSGVGGTSRGFDEDLPSSMA